jgi:hypothetical protein
MIEPLEEHKRPDCTHAFRKSDDWVRWSLLASVLTVSVGTAGFGIQMANLTRLYEQRQTTVEVKLEHIAEEIQEVKRNIKE